MVRFSYNFQPESSAWRELTNPLVAQRTEELVSGLVKHVTGGYITRFTNQHGKEFEINWEAPWRRIDMIPE